MAGSITTLGLGSGLDLQNILEQLKSVDQIPIINKQAKQVEYKSQLTEFDTVKTKLLAVKTAAFNLSLNDTFDSKSITSSNESVLTATASSSAATGSYNLTVSSLARKNSWQSSGVAARNSTITIAAGEFTYTVDGHQTTVAVTENMTMEQLMAAINDDENNPGVTASIMDDGSGTDAFHLTLVSSETGDDNALTIGTNNTDLTFNEIQAVGTLNAQFTLNGIDYQRGSNSINDVINGVTLDLVGNGSATIKVSADTEGLSEEIFGLVDAYNDAIAEITTNAAYNEETGESGLLNGLSSFTSIKSQLNSILFNSIDGLSGNISSLIDIGFEYNRDGSISIDETKLDEALSDNLDSVKELFVGNSDQNIDGIAEQLNDQLRYLTKYNGVLSNEKTRVQTNIDRLDDQIETAQKRLDAKYETMAKVFAELDKFMSNMQAQGNALQLQIDSFANLLSNK